MFTFNKNTKEIIPVIPRIITLYRKMDFLTSKGEH